MRLFFYKFYTAVFRTTFVGRVISEGCGLTHAFRRKAVSSDTHRNEFIHEGLCALLAQFLVAGYGSCVIRMPLHLELEVGVILHQLRNTVNLGHRLGFDIRLADIEGDGVGDDLAVRHEAVVERHGACAETDVGH